jgi:hypothetical protein
MKMRSNLESSEGGRLIFSCGLFFLLYLPYTGLAAAKMEDLALRVVVIPAFAMDTVYYSITSWIEVRSDSSILSNSSIQQIPLSERTRAPPSSVTSPVN